MDKQKHAVWLRVSYDSDEGIEMVCECRWTKVLGHEPEVEDVVAAEAMHLSEVGA